ncbi:MAG: T9SS C-terminal target domain-containing protein [Haliscomenobacteraceae bacterium CHB4]|nr:hypothetical protein [Saprospiraceae bacterium]MCE7922408.1 T9SS C-terminal target domain-containing protein [Haliscomenobacteraceae bacterium CHB4]
MKKTTFTLLLSLSCCWLAAQCPTGDIAFSTQGQIDSFQINYPGCTDFPGSITISGSDITSLQGLSTLDSIGGCLLIGNNPLLISLNGLGNLNYIGECETGTLTIKAKRGLEVWNNALLTSISGMQNLKFVKGCIQVTSNSAMTALNIPNGLSSLGTCAIKIGSNGWKNSHSLGIYANYSLKTIGGQPILDSLEILRIEENYALTSLNGLENIVSIRKMYLFGTLLLPNFKGLDNLQSLGGLHIEGNASLKNFQGLENLKSITYYGPDQLGFAGLTMNIIYNDSLINFSGLENLQNIGDPSGSGSVEIVGNSQLNSLTGMGGSFSAISDLIIRENPKLAICAAHPVCELLENGGIANISDNAPGCNSIPEVLAACIVSIEKTSTGEPVVLFSPNPASDFLQIQINDSEKWEISLFDLQGRQMFRQSVSGSQIIEVKDWLSGVYALRAVSGGRVFSGKIVKQ